LANITGGAEMIAVEIKRADDTWWETVEHIGIFGIEGWWNIFENIGDWPFDKCLLYTYEDLP
jgi:hypothetical protein